MPGRAEVGAERPPVGLGDAVEQHALDPLVIVEVLEMHELRQRQLRGAVDRRPAVEREWTAVGAAERIDAEQLGDAGAARHVRLLHVDGAGGQHPLEVRQRRSRTRPPRRSSPAAPARVRRAGPRDRPRRPAPRTSSRRPARRMPPRARAPGARVCAVGVDEQLRLLADRGARQPHPHRVTIRLGPHLHLHLWDPCSTHPLS